MKTKMLGVVIMTLLCLPTAYAEERAPQDVAAIKSLIESMAVLADSNNFESLEKIFAEEIEVDYSSLSGAPMDVKSPQTLMTEWASILPGFDCTRHNISDITVKVNGATATGEAHVTAEHFVGGLYWQVIGTYDYAFQKEAGQWRMSKLTFTLKEEKGVRDVFGPAAKNAAETPAPYILRKKTKQAILDFLHALESKDMEKFAAVWAEDAVQDMPYSPKGFPKRVTGKKSIVELYVGWPKTAGDTDFTSQLVFYPMQDPETIFVEFKGDVDVIPTGKNYRQSYGGLFHVENGKIKLYREYYDPAPFVEAFNIGS